MDSFNSYLKKIKKEVEGWLDINAIIKDKRFKVDEDILFNRRLNLDLNHRGFGKYYYYHGWLMSYIPKKMLHILERRGWKPKKYFFNFIGEPHSKDIKIYNLWNRRHSTLKKVYSLVHRFSKHKDVYAMTYRTLLAHPFWLVIKPYVILLKNFTDRYFWIVMEKSLIKESKWIKIKALIKLKHYRGLNLLNNSNFYKYFFNLSQDFFKKINYISVKNKSDVLLSFRKKINLLFINEDKWLSCYRRKGSIFVKKTDYLTDESKYEIVKWFEYLHNNKYNNYINFLVVYRNLKKKKKIYNLKTSKFLNKDKFIKNPQDRNNYFTYRKLYFNNHNHWQLSFISRIYLIYFFWLVYFFQGQRTYLYKLTFNYWAKHFVTVNKIIKLDQLGLFFYYKNTYSNRFLKMGNTLEKSTYDFMKFIYDKYYVNLHRLGSSDDDLDYLKNFFRYKSNNLIFFFNYLKKFTERKSFLLDFIPHKNYSFRVSLKKQFFNVNFLSKHRKIKEKKRDKRNKQDHLEEKKAFMPKFDEIDFYRVQWMESVFNSERTGLSTNKEYISPKYFTYQWPLIKSKRLYYH